MGALLHGLPMAGERHVGGTFGWLSPFALACAIIILAIRARQDLAPFLGSILLFKVVPNDHHCE